jgi:intracellular septation protein A
MSDLLHSGKSLALDLASTLLFMGVLALGGSMALAVGLAVALAFAQLAWTFRKGEKVDALQWSSLIVVVVSGGASLLTNDPRFVMLKPTLLYALVGVAMLQRGWMARYLPQDANDYLPDLVITFGYVWAGLMFLSAALNLVLALSLSVGQWGAAISLWGAASKLALFFIQYAVMKWIGKRRYQAAQA